MAGGAIESGRSVVSRVAAILMAFGTGGTHSLTELAKLAGLPISTTHRLVGDLVSRRVLERTEGGLYRVGLPLRMIGGLTAPTSVRPLLEQALDVLGDVAAVTGTAVRVGVLDAQRAVVTVTGPGRTPADGFSDDPVPAQESALGRVLLAFSPPEVVDEVITAARATAQGSTLSPDRLRRLLATTRLSRVAVHRDADGGRCEVAVPVFGTGGSLLAALGATVPQLTTAFEQTRGALLVAAGSLSRQLATSPVLDEPALAVGPEIEAG
jgi:DNA-binding IclR family transcriptional regulator